MKKTIFIAPLITVLFSGCFLSTGTKVENQEKTIEPIKTTVQTTGTFKSNPIYGPALIEQNFKVFMDIDGSKISPDYKNCILETYAKGNLNPFRINFDLKQITCDSNEGQKTLKVKTGNIIGSDNFSGISGDIFERTGTKLSNEATDEETKNIFASLKEQEILVIKGTEENTLNVFFSIVNE